jgi:hypothetical protein
MARLTSKQRKTLKEDGAFFENCDNCYRRAWLIDCWNTTDQWKTNYMMPEHLCEDCGGWDLSQIVE